jgi:hypothetical protein
MIKRWYYFLTGGEFREFVRWRENVLIDYEDACFRVAREREPTPEGRAFFDRIIEERARNRREHPDPLAHCTGPHRDEK